MSETQNTEYKSVWKDEYLKWLCGFANANGGVLCIGKNDCGEIVGVKDTKKLLEELPNKIRTTMGMVADVSLMTENKKDCIIITIQPYPSPISYHGKYYLRSGATNQELTGNALDEFMLRKQGKTWDSVPVPFVKIEDLDKETFSLFRKKAVESKRLSDEDLTMDDQTLLKNLILTENEYMRRAAILLFHKNPEQFVFGSYVKIGFFEDSEILYQDEFHGSLLSMTDKIMETIRLKYLKGWISYVGISRIETYTVPLPAIREAVLNAIVHKDYSSGVPIQIRIYEDKIQISNTGHLPVELTAETMLQSNTSRPHNPLIANTFFRCGFIESWGRGIDKMNKACIADGLQSPVYQTISDSVIIKFEGHKPEKFIDKETGSPKYWNDSEEQEKEFEIKQKIERINNIFERVNWQNERVNDENERVNEKNERVNERVKNELQILYSIIEDNPLIKISSIEKINKKSNATNRRYLKILKDNNLIEFIGSNKTGGYKIVVN
jgi:ATP-dependent DNA helicase RecG